MSDGKEHDSSSVEPVVVPLAQSAAVEGGRVIPHPVAATAPADNRPSQPEAPRLHPADIDQIVDRVAETLRPVMAETVARIVRGRRRPSEAALGKYLTVAEVAELTRAPVSSVRSWIYEQRLPARKVGKRVLVAEEDLSRFLHGAPAIQSPWRR